MREKPILRAAEGVGPYKRSPSRLLLAQGEGVCDHRDELAIRGLSLDVRYRVAEVLLQHLDVAPPSANPAA